jgi:DNA helicase-2/ATP-dependent DNA helicase PcrA
MLGPWGALPYPLRGDAAEYPTGGESARSQTHLAEELARFRVECGAHEVNEERRLCYVAVTRARRGCC